MKNRTKNILAAITFLLASIFYFWLMFVVK